MTNTRYYDEHQDQIFKAYQALDPEELHQVWAKDLIKNRKAGAACDIGAGSGRDANWLAKLGWEVVAVEPSKLRELGKEISDPRVTWLDDSLPSLKTLRSLGHRFDLILLNAVWQHVRTSERKRVFRVLCELLNPAGLLLFSLRKGEDESENQAREFHPVNSAELIQLGNQHAVEHRAEYLNRQDLARKHVNWDWQIFEMPDDGTGNLPLLRHIIVNDNKSASYKLGLLRTLVKLAENAPGVVTKREEDYVEVPFGAVGLYWIKLYHPLILQRGLRQRPPGPGGYGFAQDAFYSLEHTSPSVLDLGYRFDVDRADSLRKAILDVCRNIQIMPANFITYPGDANRQVFECEAKTVQKHQGPVTLSKDYLSDFGTFRIPSLLWQTLGQFACWLDPAIVREWKQLIIPWQNKGQLDAADNYAFEWGSSQRETTTVSSRARQVRNEGFPLTCIWSAKLLKSKSNLAIDHCFPWSRWPNNDLWNLLPTRADVNLKKSDRLPAAETLADAQARIVSWWDRAWLDTPQEEQFFIEANFALPGLSSEKPSLERIHEATEHQRRRLKQDQQIPEWPPLNKAIDLS